MDDLISRQAAIDVLNKLAKDNFTINDMFSFYLGALHDAADGIKQLPSAQPEQQWIPCSERLPEEYGEYQITWKTSFVPQKRFIGYCEYEITNEWDTENGRFKGEWLLDDSLKAYQDVKVIAWMPKYVPEPWKGEWS